ncbi:hypothetical protein EFL79_06545 [Weissella confusa]|nr:hypothetical protein [Weissella confusa]
MFCHVNLPHFLKNFIFMLFHKQKNVCELSILIYSNTFPALCELNNNKFSQTKSKKKDRYFRNSGLNA